MFSEGTAVPTELRHEAFVATPLTRDLAALDYTAYMASPDVIRVHSGGRWPVEGFTLEEDRRLIEQHEADHEKRRAFAFLLLDPSANEALGCVYLNPLHDYLRDAGADPRTCAAFPPESAMVTFWVRQDRQDTLPTAVLEAVNTWLLSDWPLKTHVFRLVPAEHRPSQSTLERLGLRRLDLELAAESRPYRWYQPR